MQSRDGGRAFGRGRESHGQGRDGYGQGQEGFGQGRGGFGDGKNGRGGERTGARVNTWKRKESAAEAGNRDDGEATEDK